MKRKGSTMKRVKTTGLTAEQASAVRAISKQVVLNTAETKSFIQTTSAALFNDLVYAQNLNFGLQQGVTADQLIGEKIFIKNIYARYKLVGTNNATASNENTAIRVLVIRTKKALTNTFASITKGDVFRGSSFNMAYSGLVDLHEVDLLFDEIHVFEQPNIAAVNQAGFMDIKISVNKTHYFDTDNGGYFKDKNYYMIVMAQKENVSIGADVGLISGQCVLNFKDS